LDYIKIEYEKRFERSLFLDVEDELSGDYQALLLSLIGKG